MVMEVIIITLIQVSSTQDECFEFKCPIAFSLFSPLHIIVICIFSIPLTSRLLGLLHSDLVD